LVIDVFPDCQIQRIAGVNHVSANLGLFFEMWVKSRDQLGYGHFVHMIINFHNQGIAFLSSDPEKICLLLGPVLGNPHPEQILIIKIKLPVLANLDGALFTVWSPRPFVTFGY
jgi:hypothetical protein